MSLLDDLKKEAAAQKAANDVDEQQARLEARYQERVKPAMLSILHYLAELTDQLKLVDPNIRVDYTLPGIGKVSGLHQGEYVVNADNTENTKFIRLRFTCSDENEHEYAVKPKSTADETRDFLKPKPCAMPSGRYEIQYRGSLASIFN